MTVSFLDSAGGALFFKDIETERYGPEFRYHGLIEDVSMIKLLKNGNTVWEYNLIMTYISLILS